MGIGFPPVNISTIFCVEALKARWISRFGVPDDLTSNRGTQFTVGLKTDFCHPQANGLVETFHRQLKEALMSKLTRDGLVSSFPWVLLGLRSAPKEDMGLSSAELVYGEPLTLPGELLSSPDTPVETFVARVRTGASSFKPPVNRPGRPVSSPGIPPVLAATSHVDVLRGGNLPPLLPPRYTGPFVVLEKGAKTFRMAVGKREEIVSVDRLKPHLGTSLASPAEPPR